MKYFILLFLLMVTFSCDKREQSAESVLKKYIDYRFEDNQTRDEILKNTTGPLYNELLNLTAEQFEKLIDVKKYKKRKLKILSNQCEDLSCILTYSISYFQGKGNMFSVEVRKIARMLKIEGRWKVSDVTNIKTHIDNRKPIEP